MNGFDSKPNFDKTKILLDVQSDGTLMVIDPKTKNVFPLYGQYFDVKKNNKIIRNREVFYGLNNNKICVSGYKYAYRDLGDDGKYCYLFNGVGFENYNNSIKNTSDILSESLSKLKPTILPLSSGSIINKSSILDASKISNSLFNYIVNHGGKIIINSSIIRLPNFNNKIVFITQYDESSEISTYFINVFENGVGHSKLLGTGVFFEIDNKFNIKVKSFEKDKVKITFFKVGNSGTILSSDSSFN